MATPRPGFDNTGNRRNSRLVPSTDNDVARRLKLAIISAQLGFIAPDTITDAIAATGILTATGNLDDGDIVTIDAKVYTFQDTLTDVDGNVHIGATASDTLDNLIDAINLAGAGGAPDYADSMTIHPTVSAAAGAGDTVDATAKTRGTGGNAIATTDDNANVSWAAVVLEDGLDSPSVGLANLEPGDKITVEDTAGQDGTYEVDTVGADSIATVEQTITTEAASANTVKVDNNRNTNRFAA